MIPWIRGCRRKWIWVAAAGFLGACVVGLLAANLVVVCGAASHIKGASDLPHCDVAIVLGAKVQPGGEPSATLEDRLQTAVELYRAGVVRKLLLSGDHGRRTYDEVNGMRRFILTAGVPQEDVFLDHAGFSTYQTMYRARDVFQVKQAIVVTQRFHLARSVYTARQLGLDAWGCEADKRPYASAVRNMVREWLARAKALFELHVRRPKPRFLGPSIPITGDGRATWDETE